MAVQLPRSALAPQGKYLIKVEQSERTCQRTSRLELERLSHLFSLERAVQLGDRIRSLYKVLKTSSQKKVRKRTF